MGKFSDINTVELIEKQKWNKAQSIMVEQNMGLYGV